MFCIQFVFVPLGEIPKIRISHKVSSKNPEAVEWGGGGVIATYILEPEEVL